MLFPDQGIQCTPADVYERAINTVCESVYVAHNTLYEWSTKPGSVGSVNPCCVWVCLYIVLHDTAVSYSPGHGKLVLEALYCVHIHVQLAIRNGQCFGGHEMECEVGLLVGVRAQVMVTMAWITHIECCVCTQLVEE